MRYRHRHKTVPSFRGFDDLEENADQFASEQFVGSSDRFAIHLHINSFRTQLDVITAGPSSNTLHFPEKSQSANNSQGKTGLPFIFMADSLPTESSTPSDALKMARTYSTGELLNMRDTLPFVVCDMTKLNSAVASGIDFPFLCCSYCLT
jgi:hypothetical protein